jgi:hypothetical protein
MANPLTIDGHMVPDPGITGEVYDENGITTVTCPVLFPTLLIALAFDPARVATVLGLSGVKLTGSPITKWVEQQVIVTYTFKGIQSTWNFAKSDAAATFLFTPADLDIPIGANPNFATLKADYGWTPDDPNDPQGPGHFPYYKKASSANGASPLYGTASFLGTGGDFRKIYVASALPSGLYTNVGKLFASPSGIGGTIAASLSSIAAPQKRGWLKRCPQWETKGIGSAIRIQEVWRLTGPNGYTADTQKIYQGG